MGSTQKVNLGRYESESVLNQYLLFHYGSEEDLLPYSYGPKNSLHFPVRCVQECINADLLPKKAEALELGCAVGRSSFELAQYCEHVVAVDSSEIFIQAACELKRKGQLEYTIIEEGTKWATRIAKVPQGVDTARVEFHCEDALNFIQNSSSYHVVLAANLICRLSEPIKFLGNIGRVLLPDGQLILTSPYSWSEEFTQKINWLHNKEKSPLEYLDSILQKDFKLERFF